MQSIYATKMHEKISHCFLGTRLVYYASTLQISWLGERFNWDRAVVFRFCLVVPFVYFVALLYMLPDIRQHQFLLSTMFWNTNTTLTFVFPYIRGRIIPLYGNDIQCPVLCCLQRGERKRKTVQPLVMNYVSIFSNFPMSLCFEITLWNFGPYL